MHYKNKSFMTKKKAFTLIELLIVIAIIGILFIVLVSKVDFATDKAKATGVQTDFRSFQVAIESVAKENAGLATFGWDTGDTNGDRIRNSYDKGDTNKNGKQDAGEVFVGSKTYGETWTNVYTLTNPADANDKSAIVALEEAINKNLDPKLHITINDNLTITMANGAQDPWDTEYHGYYITNATVDNKDRGAIVMYSNGANQEFGSEHSIANGVVSVSVPGNNKLGKDDYSIAVVYTYVNGYGEVKTATTGFSNNQGNQGNNAGGSGYNDPEGTLRDETITNITELVAPNKGYGINDYSWSQIQLLARAKLSAEEYKSLYGIELGQMVNNQYMLVDFYDYGGFVFMNNAGSEWHYGSQGKEQVGGYASSDVAREVELRYEWLPDEIKNVIKEVTIKCNDIVDYNTIHEYTCKYFLPSQKELGGSGHSDSSLNTALNQEGALFDYFSSQVKIKTLRVPKSEHTVLTRSIRNSNDYFSVMPQYNGVVAWNTFVLSPCFVVGFNGNEITPENKNTIPEENPSGTIDSYSWLELKALAQLKLTPEEYKSKYGIELGQRKGYRYVLVDIDNENYDGFVFIDSGSFTHEAMHNDKSLDGYGSSTLIQTMDSFYNKYSFDLQFAIKQVPVKYYNNSSLQTINQFCFLPSLVELGFDLSEIPADKLSKIHAEGKVFNYLANPENLLNVCTYNGNQPHEWAYLWTRTLFEYSSAGYSQFYVVSPVRLDIDNMYSNYKNSHPRSYDYFVAFVIGGNCVTGHYDQNNDGNCDGCGGKMCNLGYGHKDVNKDGFCDICNRADCSEGIHSTIGNSYTCQSCQKGLCSLGYEHRDSNSDGVCEGCNKCLCSVGYEHMNNGFWTCKYCKKPFCELGYEHQDIGDDGYCDGCNIVWCQYGACHDLTNDGLCDWCGEPAECDHYDGYYSEIYDEWVDRDGYCDICGEFLAGSCEHIDGYYDEFDDLWYNRDGYCDNCGLSMRDVCSHKDGDFYDGWFEDYEAEHGTSDPSPMWISNADGYCDNCGEHMCNLGFYGYDNDGDAKCDGCYEPLCLNPWDSNYIYDEYYPHNCNYGWMHQDNYGYCGGCQVPMCFVDSSYYHTDGYMSWDEFGNCSLYEPDDGYCDYCDTQISCQNNGWSEPYPCYDVVNSETGYTDGICDSCGNYMCVNHYDTDGDGYCNDACMGYNAPPCPDHYDYDGDGYCDYCCIMADGDGGSDICYNHYNDYDYWCENCGGYVEMGTYCYYHYDDDYDGYCNSCYNIFMS